MAIGSFSASVSADSLPAETSTSGRLIVMEENDKFASDDDRHYTQGVRLSYLSGSVTPDGFWDQPYGLVKDNLPAFSGSDRKRKYEWTVGQSIFTPTNTTQENPLLKDRPYVAWLYTGAGLLQETYHSDYKTLENLELLMGVVGPAALGKVTQNDFHQFIGDDSSLGWKNEIKTEPGFVLSYERKWRFQKPLWRRLAVDVIPELGISGGNVLSYGQASVMMRFGQNLAVDYGPDRIRPSLSGTGWFDPAQLSGKLGWYVFLGAQGRAVGQNIFLDGNTYLLSQSVDKKTLVADFMAGASLFWSAASRVDFTVIERTKEFYGQQGRRDRFGGLNIAFQF